MRSKYFIFSANILAMIGAGVICSYAVAQDRPNPDMLQRLQQKEGKFHNRIVEHNQAMQEKMQQRRDEANRFKNFRKDQKQRFQDYKDQKRQEWKDLKGQTKQDMHNMTHPDYRKNYRENNQYNPQR